MRYLHAVSAAERFVGRGSYTYSIDGDLSGVSEHWSVHEVGDGGHFIRLDYDGRDANAHNVLAEAFRNPDGQVDRVDIVELLIDEQGKPAKNRHHFIHFGDHIQVTHNFHGQEHITVEEFACTPNTVLLAPFVYFGGVFARLQTDTLPVFQIQLDGSVAIIQAKIKQCDEKLPVTGNTKATRCLEVLKRNIFLDANEVVIYAEEDHEDQVFFATINQYAYFKS